MNPNGFGRASRGQAGGQGQYTLMGRGVARGRGRLWEPGQ